MDISGEVADILMRTDAKNLVKTARTIHLLEEKETIHICFPCSVRKPVQEVFMILLSFNSKLFGRLLDAVIGESRQFDHSRKSC